MTRRRRLDSDRLFFYRDLRWMTQEQLARQAGVSPDTISRMENGFRPHPHNKTLFRIAKALEVSPEDLLERDSGDPLTLGNGAADDEPQSGRRHRVG